MSFFFFVVVVVVVLDIVVQALEQFEGGKVLLCLETIEKCIQGFNGNTTTLRTRLCIEFFLLAQHKLIRSVFSSDFSIIKSTPFLEVVSTF